MTIYYKLVQFCYQCILNYYFDHIALRQPKDKYVVVDKVDRKRPRVLSTTHCHWSVNLKKVMGLTVTVAVRKTEDIVVWKQVVLPKWLSTTATTFSNDENNEGEM